MKIQSRNVTTQGISMCVAQVSDSGLFRAVDGTQRVSFQMPPAEGPAAAAAGDTKQDGSAAAAGDTRQDGSAATASKMAAAPHPNASPRLDSAVAATRSSPPKLLRTTVRPSASALHDGSAVGSGAVNAARLDSEDLSVGASAPDVHRTLERLQARVNDLVAETLRDISRVHGPGRRGGAEQQSCCGSVEGFMRVESTSTSNGGERPAGESFNRRSGGSRSTSMKVARQSHRTSCDCHSFTSLGGRSVNSNNSFDNSYTKGNRALQSLNPREQTLTITGQAHSFYRQPPTRAAATAATMVAMAGGARRSGSVLAIAEDVDPSSLTPPSQATPVEASEGPSPDRPHSPHVHMAPTVNERAGGSVHGPSRRHPRQRWRLVRDVVKAESALRQVGGTRANGGSSFGCRRTSTDTAARGGGSDRGAPRRRSSVVSGVVGSVAGVIGGASAGTSSFAAARSNGGSPPNAANGLVGGGVAMGRRRDAAKPRRMSFMGNEIQAAAMAVAGNDGGGETTALDAVLEAQMRQARLRMQGQDPELMKSLFGLDADSLLFVDEEIEKKAQHWYILHPLTWRRMAWDLVMGGLIVLTTIETPFSIAFLASSAELTPTHRGMNYAVDGAGSARDGTRCASPMREPDARAGCASPMLAPSGAAQGGARGAAAPGPPSTHPTHHHHRHHHTPPPPNVRCAWSLRPVLPCD